MSVETEITRISGAKSDIATAITNKGVTVPSGTKLDGMAALIDSISGGGGGGSVETCTLEINIREDYVICVTVYENGEINSIKLSLYGLTIIENVVCNSCFSIYSRAKPLDETYSDTVSILHSHSTYKVFRISGYGSIYWG